MVAAPPDDPLPRPIRQGALQGSPSMSTQDSGLLRKAQVLAFLLKHRNAGVFGGLARDAADEADEHPTVEGDDGGAPARFVAELEALGPAFIKVGQALSTRPDMVPPLDIASLAQVNRATLRDGRAVAVKVQRPGIRDAIRSELDAIASLAGTSDR